MEPEIWVIVPASRPNTTIRTLGNFRDQEYQNKHLLVVENGEAIGSYAPFEMADKVLRSEQHPGAARNVALRWLKENRPEAYAACMDDDDYYGGSYLTEHAANAEKGKVNGKWSGWTQFDDHLVYFGHNWEPGSSRRHLFGGTLGFFVSDVGEFPEDTVIGEDSAFCARSADSGLQVETLSSKHYCCSREGSPKSHTHKASEQKYWRRFGPRGVVAPGRWGDWIDKEPPDGPREYYSKGVLE